MALKRILNDYLDGKNLSAEDGALAAYPNHFKSTENGGFNYSFSQTPLFDGVTQPGTLPSDGITLNFRQLNFDFGKFPAFDRPNNGFSPEPFIRKSFINLRDNAFLNTVSEGFMRGGIELHTQRKIEDAARIGQWLSTPEGFIWNLKQVGMQATNPKISRPGRGFSRANQRVYNLGLNTLASVAAAGTGVYFKREGETFLLPDRATYAADEGLFEDPGENTPSYNRMINLFDEHIFGIGAPPKEEKNNFFAKVGKFINKIDTAIKKFVGATGEELYSYIGGPGAAYGIGQTEIRKFKPFVSEGTERPVGVGARLKNPALTLRRSRLVGDDGIQHGFITNGNFNITPNTLLLNFDNGGVAYPPLYAKYVDEGVSLPSGESPPTEETITGPNKYIFPGDGGEDALSDRHIGRSQGIVRYSDASQHIGNAITTVNSIFSGVGLWYTSLNHSVLNGNLTQGTNTSVSSGPVLPPEGADRLSDKDVVIPEFPKVSLNSIQDFRMVRRGLDDVANTAILAAGVTPNLQPSGEWGATNYNATTNLGRGYNIEARVSIGHQGKRHEREGRNHFGGFTKDYDIFDYDTIDQINALDVFKGSIREKAFMRDLVRFRIEAMDGDDPSKSTTMLFRSFLDDFSDNYTGEWNSFKYNGRAEDFFTYKGFKRTLNFSFKIAAMTRHEMLPLYRKLNYLLTQTAPDYSGTRMRGSYCRLTIGSLINRTPGFFTNVKYKWNKNYPWEISINHLENGPDKDGAMVMPHLLDVSCAFTPIHTFTPQKSVTKSPFILPHGTKKAQQWDREGAAENSTKAQMAEGDRWKKWGDQSNIDQDPGPTLTPITTPPNNNEQRLMETPIAIPLSPGTLPVSNDADLLPIQTNPSVTEESERQTKRDQKKAEREQKRLTRQRDRFARQEERENDRNRRRNNRNIGTFDLMDSPIGSGVV